MTCLAAGLQGWLIRRATLVERAIFIAAALPLIIPGLYTDLAGVGLLAVNVTSQLWRGKRAKAASLLAGGEGTGSG